MDTYRPAFSSGNSIPCNKTQNRNRLSGKDRIESKIRHLAVALIIIIVTSPLWEFAIGNGVLPFECTPATQITTSTHTIRTFSDGSSEKNIRFITGGGFNSDASLDCLMKPKSSKPASK